MDDQREYFRLWWEYLRRSARYKDYCEKYGTPGQYYDQDMNHTFGENGDVHKIDFETWYQFKKLQQSQGKPQTTVVEYAQEYILESIQTAGDSLRTKLGREPTLSEFEAFYTNPYNAESLYQCVGTCSFVVHPVLGGTNKDACGDINGFLKGSALRRKTIKYDELKKYLEVYDLFQTCGNIHEVIRRHSRPDYDLNVTEEADTLQRDYRRYRYKAEQIIKNTEQNHFPGTFE